MISKKKQDYELDIKFDPKLVELRRTKPFKETDHFAHEVEVVVKNSTMGYGERIRAEFFPIKSVEEFNKKRDDLREFSKKMKSKVFEPISILINDGDKLYCTHIGAPDSSKKLK
jgi:hypothetical protein